MTEHGRRDMAGRPTWQRTMVSHLVVALALALVAGLIFDGDPVAWWTAGAVLVGVVIGDQVATRRRRGSGEDI